MIQEKTETPFTLAVDLDNEQTGRYSPGRREFTGYVINSQGTITSIFEGNLRNRAKSEELLKAIKSAADSGTKKGSDKKEGSDSKQGSDDKD